MEIKQQLRLSQQLVMTPQLQQAIKLLQMSRIELEALVREEMLENPVLEDSLESGGSDGGGGDSADNAEMTTIDRAVAADDAPKGEAKETEKKAEEIRLGALSGEPLAPAADPLLPARKRGRAPGLRGHPQRGRGPRRPHVVAGPHERFGRGRAALRGAGARQPRRRRLPQVGGRGPRGRGPQARRRGGTAPGGRRGGAEDHPADGSDSASPPARWPSASTCRPTTSGWTSWS